VTQQPSESSLTSSTAEQTNSLPEPGVSEITRRNILKGVAAGAGAVSLGALGGLALPPTVVAAVPPQAASAPLQAVSAPLQAASAPSGITFPGAGKLREYWFQADSFIHNIVPTGVDGMTGSTFMPDQTRFWAIGYRAFTPGWGKPLPGNDDIGPNTGIPGPIIRGEVGDTIRVHFRNNNTYYKTPHSISVHALHYTQENDGGWAWMHRDRPGTAIKFGESYTYEWKAIPRSVGTWPYHDHGPHFDPGRGAMVMEAGAELGLYGMLVVIDEHTAKVDKELTTVWNTFYQGDIPGLGQNFHCFDGLAYLGNTPTLRAKVGQRVRWRAVFLGNDFHTFHIHAHTWLTNGRYDDTIVVGPGSTLTLDYLEDAPGTWYYHCHVTMHVMGPGMGGMIGIYEVEP